MRLSVVFLATLTACGEAFPSDAQLLTVPDDAYALWLGLGNPRTCESPMVARVSTDEFEDRWGTPNSSCARLPFPKFWGNCEVSFSEQFSEGTVIFFDENLRLNNVAYEGTITHELFHAWSACLTGDSDPGHRTKVWAKDPYVLGKLPSTWARE